MKKRSISSVGSVAKKVSIAGVEHETHSQALILESLYPFPGYHGTTVPDNSEPQALFFMTAIHNSDDRIIRAIMDIKKDFGFDFDAAPATMSLFNKPAAAVRVADIQYNQSGKLIAAFEKQGIQFLKKKKVSPYESIVHITKYFELEEIVDGIFADTRWENMNYIRISSPLRWNTFEKITQEIKHNVDDKNFDAAIMHLYDEKGILDFVRIYDEKSCQGKLVFIREKYEEAIKKLGK